MLALRSQHPYSRPTAPAPVSMHSPRPEEGSRTAPGGAGGQTLAAAIRRAGHIPPRLREALARACEDGAPIRTVEKLASAAGCDRRTLWTHWKSAVGPDSELRLQDFLHWLLLLRAASSKSAGRAWADVAEEVGIHPHTLGRLARQLTGRTLRDLAAGGPAALSRRFEAEVLPDLLRPPGAEQLRRLGWTAPRTGKR